MKSLFFFNICREADESRLREVCENFLGPPMGMLGSASSTDPKNQAWDPDVLVSLHTKLLFCIFTSTKDGLFAF
jgi:hypothetical protein